MKLITEMLRQAIREEIKNYHEKDKPLRTDEIAIEHHRDGKFKIFFPEEYGDTIATYPQSEAEVIEDITTWLNKEFRKK